MSTPSLAKRFVAELVGTALLLATVVGSGIMGETLAGGNTAIALLANTIATGAGLVAFILALGPISGAHFNPAVTLADATQGGLPWREVPVYLAAQIAGAFAGCCPSCRRARRESSTASRWRMRHDPRSLRVCPQRRAFPNGGGALQRGRRPGEGARGLRRDRPGTAGPPGGRGGASRGGDR